MNLMGLKRCGRVRRPAFFAALAGLFVAAGAAPQEKAPAPASAPALPAVIYTKDDAPTAPKPEDLPLQESVTLHGITWTFEKAARVGQFVNGDWYVVGPVTVVGMDPKPVYEANRVRNGSMLNPEALIQKQAFDSRSLKPESFKPELLAKLPIAMKPGDSLVSSISRVTARRDNEALKSLSVLTCLAGPVPPDAFRPGFCDKDRTIYLARNLRRELLPRLPKVEGTPEIRDVEKVYERTWWELGYGGMHEPEYQSNYGRAVCENASRATLLLMLDFTPQEKETLLIRFIQYGLDLWGIIKTDGFMGWGTLGGWGSGRKWPVVFTGVMLGDDKMACPTKSCPQLIFQEDNQVHYDDCWTGANVVYAGHSGWAFKAPASRQYSWGPYENVHPSRWTGWIGTSYRTNMTSSTWMGQALAIRILQAEKVWAGEAFLDYCDRWMHEPDPGFRNPARESTQGHSKIAFFEAMWKAYREKLPAIPGRDNAPRPPTGWKKERQLKGPAVTVGKNRELIVGGKPFFPIMVFCEDPRRVDEVAAVGVNVAAEGIFEKEDSFRDFWLLNIMDEKLMQELVAGDRSKRYAVGKNVAVRTSNDQFLDALAAKGLYGVIGADARAIGHPALLGWIHLDEADKGTAKRKINITAKGCKGIGHPIEQLFDGDKTMSGRTLIEDLNGAQITLHMTEPVTASAIVVYSLPGGEGFCAAKDVSFLLDGKEALKVTVTNTDSRKDGPQEFKMEKPVSFKELTFRVNSVYPASKGGEYANAGALLEIEARDEAGKTVPLGDPIDTLGMGHEGYAIIKASQKIGAPEELTRIPDDLLMVQPAYEWMKKVDATRPVFMTVGQTFFKAAAKPGKKELIQSFLKDCEVVGCRMPADKLADSVKKLRELAPGKPVFAWIETKGAKPEEVRSAVRSAIAAGATGIGYRGFEGLKGEKPGADVMAELKRINGTIAAHAAELLADPAKAEELLK